MVGVQSGRGLRQLGTLFTRGAIGHKTDAELLDLFAAGAITAKRRSRPWSCTMGLRS